MIGESAPVILARVDAEHGFARVGIDEGAVQKTALSVDDLDGVPDPVSEHFYAVAGLLAVEAHGVGNYV